MAALTENFRHTAALGPFKVEFIKVTGNSSQDAADTSLSSRLVNPRAAAFLPVNDDLGGTADGGSVELTSGTQAFTVHDLSNSQEAMIMILGF